MAKRSADHLEEMPTGDEARRESLHSIATSMRSWKIPVKREHHKLIGDVETLEILIMDILDPDLKQDVPADRYDKLKSDYNQLAHQVHGINTVSHEPAPETQLLPSLQESQTQLLSGPALETQLIPESQSQLQLLDEDSQNAAEAAEAPDIDT